MLQLKHLGLSHYIPSWFRSPARQSLLHHIDLQLQCGELIALVGSSGEGKSLLLQTLLGLLPDGFQRSGEILLNQQYISDQQLVQLRGKVFGYIPQSVSALNPLLKVGKQMRRVAILGGTEATQETLQTQLARYHLTGSVLDQYPLALSGGMAKRVLASCATLNQAQFIFADEVTAWLDHYHANIILQHLRELCQQGRGVLWVTHDLHLAASFADRVAVLHQGTLKEVITAQALRQGQGSPWLQSLWRALPEHDFMHSTYISKPASC